MALIERESICTTFLWLCLGSFLLIGCSHVQPGYKEYPEQIRDRPESSDKPSVMVLSRIENVDGIAEAQDAPVYYYCHKSILEILYIDPELLTQWGRHDEETQYYFPREFNGQEKDNLTLEMVELAAGIPSIRFVVFSWSNATEDMLGPFIDAGTVDTFYLDGLDISAEKVRELLDLESVSTVSIHGTKIDKEEIERMRLAYPNKEIMADLKDE